MEYKRILNLPNLLENKSFFLFGPRSTGKTYLVRQQLSGKALVLDLLRANLSLRLSANPSELEEMIAADAENYSIVVIDEIQRVPELLAEVHRILEEKRGLHFLLTGSSARKLRKAGVDMLAGRAWTAHLFSLCWPEIPKFNLDRYLRYGGLPQVHQSPEPEEELYSYVETYLKEEIQAEGIVRKFPPFSRFLKAAALSNGEMLNFTQIGSDCGVSPSTVREYYSVLEDTLVGFLLEPWTASRKRKAISTAKFYFFDPGVTHTLAGTKTLERNSDLYGKSFEQFMGMEIRAYLSYSRIKDPLSFWRSTHGYEVDYLIGDHTAVEVKATQHVTANKLKGLRALAEEGVFKKLYIVSQDRLHRKKDVIVAMHWEEFLKGLWAGEIL